MRKRGKKLLAIMLAASMTLGQGSTWTLAQENVAEAIEGAAVSAQTDGEAVALSEESGDTGLFGDGTDGGDEDGSGGEITDPTPDGTQTPGDGQNDPSVDPPADDDNTGDDSENGNDDNDVPGDGENGDQGIINDGDKVDQDGDSEEKKDEIFTSPDDNKINDDSRVLTARLTVKEDTDNVFGSGILTGAGDLDDKSWDGGDNNRGYDASVENNIVRSFDSITYNVASTFSIKDQLEHKLVYEIKLPAPAGELSLDRSVMDADTIEEISNADGSKTYKCAYSLEKDYAGGGKEESIVIKVGNKLQGDEIEPEIIAYLDENKTDSAVKVSNMQKVIVTTAPMYNIVLKRKVDTSSTSRNVYDFSEEEYKENASAYSDYKVNGYMQTFGLALELTKPGRGIKGIELPNPTIGFTFNIDLSDATLNNINMPEKGFIPLLYKRSDNKRGGNGIFDIPFTSPSFNSNGIPSGCYESGDYTIEQEGTTLNVTVKNFKIDPTQYPQSNEAGTPYWSDANKILEGFFSAFQFSVIYPYQRPDGKNLQQIIGDGTVNIKATVKNMFAVSETGTETSNETKTDDNEQGATWTLQSGGNREQQIWYANRNSITSEYTSGCKWTDEDIAAAEDTAFTVLYTQSKVGPSYETENVPVAFEQLVLFDSSALKDVTFQSSYIRGESKGSYNCKVWYAVHKEHKNDPEFHLTTDENGTMKNAELDDFDYFDENPGVCDGVLVQYAGMMLSEPDLLSMTYFYTDINPKVEPEKVYMIAPITYSWTVSDFESEILSDTGKQNLSDVSRKEISDWAKEKLSGEMLDISKCTPVKLDGRNNYTVPIYENGQYIGGNNHKFHWTWADGLYIVPYITKVTTTVAQLEENGEPKNTYNLGKGQRYVDYVISPSIEYMRDVTPPEDATTTVYLEETIPDGLTYVENSAYWGGTYESHFPNPGSVKGGELCTPEVTKNSSGQTVLKWKIPKVQLKNGVLPQLHYTCKIGDELNPSNDIQEDSKTFENSTTIQTDEDKRKITEDNFNLSGTTIRTTKSKAFYIVKRGGDHLELEDESYYEMIASNTSSKAVENLCIFDTMPYNAAKDKMKKKGQYKITSLTLDLAALNNDASDIEVWYTNDSEYEGKTAAQLSESNITTDKWTKAEPSEKNGKISFSGVGLIDSWPTVIAYKDRSLEQNTVAVLRLEYAAVAGAEEDDFTNTWSMSTEDENGEKQEITSSVETDVYERTLEGTVWLDGVEPDHDGKIGDNETKLAGVKVTLFRKNENGEYVKYTAYKETVDGKEYQCLSTLYTDEKGHYKFTGLPEGEYRVKFESSDGVSLGGYDVTKYNEGTKEESSKVEEDNTEKTADDQLTSATIVDIKMPKLEQMVAEGKKSYNLPDQNLGLIVPTVKIEVNKWWNDSDNQDGVRPERVTIDLYADGVKTEKTLVLTADTGWKGTFSGLDKFKADENNNLKKITYSIQEENVDKYTATITADKENPNRYIVQNSYNPKTISITGTKTWIDGGNVDGTRPGSITIHLMANGKEVKSKTVKEADNWSWTFDNLPKYANGKLIIYKIKEDTVEDYVTEYSGESYDITNTYVISIHGTKIWDDADNQDGKRPTNITVRLMNGETEVASKTVTESDNWAWEFDNLPKYAPDGNVINYTISEDSVKDYVTEYSDESYDITNTHKPELTSVTGKKTWNDAGNQDGKRPKTITVRLHKNGKELESKEVTATDNWSWTFDNLHKYENGKEITYTVSEDAVKDYITEVTGNNIKNTYAPGKVSVFVTKDWDDANDQDGKRPEEIIIHLYANGEDTGKTLTLTKENNWMGSFKDLDEYQAKVKIQYTIKEEKAEGYDEGAITGDASTGYRIRNTHTPEVISVTGSKVWEDNNDQDGKRPEEITIRLWKGEESTGSEAGTSGKEEIAYKTVTATDNWSWTFDNLPKYENGKEVIYTVTEDTVKDYTTTVDGYNVTNTHKPLMVEVPVTKVWKDYNNEDKIRPTEVIIHLYADDEITEKTLKLSEENKWTGKFENLDKYKNGKKISYTVKEDKVSGYQCTITGDATDGYTVINSHTPTPDTPSQPDPTLSPKPSETPKQSVTPSVTPSTTPAPSTTPEPNETPEPSVTPSAEQTPTPAPTAGSLTVTKSLKVNGTAVGAENQNFYVALFEDEDCTQRVSDVKTLAFQYVSSATVTFDNLKPGKTYYVSETDENGEAILAGILDSGDIYTADFVNGNKFTVDGKNGNTVAFDNEFERIPDGFYYEGNLKVTKNLLGADGKAKNSDKTFYAGVFADADYTRLSDQVSANIIPLSLNGASSVSGETEVYMESADTVVKLYVTEVDKNGKPVEKDSSFGYSVTVQNGKVTISKDALDASVVITNQEKNTPATPQGGDDSSTQGGGSSPQSYSSGSSTVTPVKTGDNTPIMAMFLLLAASALIISTVMVKKKRNK